MVEVLLHQVHSEAVAATRYAIEHLPGGAKLIERDGRWFIDGPDFVVWAAERQGYVAKVIRPGN
jgi:hypothetical protein